MNTVKILRKITFALSLPLLLWNCGQITEVQNNPNTIPDLNQPEQIEIVTWNLKQFPLQGSTTIDSARKIMRSLDADIYCLQEIQNTASLKTLVNSLENYAVTYSRHTDFMRLAIVYRTSDLVLRDTSEIFVDNDYFFAGRPPLRADFTFHRSEEFNFSVINLHMKCCGGSENIERREEAATMLHTYLDSVRFAGMDTNMVVVGDWNNDLDDMDTSHPFHIFWADSQQYRFLTFDLATGGNTYDASYPGWSPPSFLDHILVSKALFNEASDGDIGTLRIDDYMNNYITLVSDHRPVVWEFIP